MAAEDAETFENKIGMVVNQGFLALGLEVGSRLGIFDYLIKCGKPQTSTEIAGAMGFKERYIREWLSLVVCGGIVDLSEGRYSIPPHRMLALSAASSTSMVTFSWLLSFSGRVMEDIMECFKKDGPKGVPYSKYPLLHPWRDAWMKSHYPEEEMIKTVNMVPGLLDKLEEGISMCEFGCSTGVIPLTFAKRFPKTQVYGYDINEWAILSGRQKAKELGLTNIHFDVMDCCTLPADWSGRWDYIHAYDMVHDTPKPDNLLKEVCRVLKPNCAASISEINMHTDVAKNVNIPHAQMIYGISLFHCMTVTLCQDGMGLGTAYGIEKAQELMRAAGFSKVDVTAEKHSFHAYYVCYS